MGIKGVIIIIIIVIVIIILSIKNNNSDHHYHINMFIKQLNYKDASTRTVFATNRIVCKL